MEVVSVCRILAPWRWEFTSSKRILSDFADMCDQGEGFYWMPFTHTRRARING